MSLFFEEAGRYGLGLCHCPRPGGCAAWGYLASARIWRTLPVVRALGLSQGLEDCGEEFRLFEGLEETECDPGLAGAHRFIGAATRAQHQNRGRSESRVARDLLS